MAQKELNELKKHLLTVQNRENGYGSDDECWHCAEPIDLNKDTYAQVWLFEGRTAILTHQCKVDHSQDLPAPTWVLKDQGLMESCRTVSHRRLLFLHDRQVEQLLSMLERITELDEEVFKGLLGNEPEQEKEEIEQCMLEDQIMLEQVKAQLGL